MGGARFDVFGFDQGGQGQDSAFAFVIRPEDEAEVFDADYEQQGPEDEGQDAEHIGGGGSDAILAVKTFPHGVEGAGTDVAKYYAQSCQRQDRQFFSVYFLGWYVHAVFFLCVSINRHYWRLSVKEQ